MDWKRIKKKYPKAWKLLCKAHSTKEVWGYIDNPDVWNMDGLDISHYELRHLYDFFDEHGIYIGLVIGNNNMDKSQPPIFEYEILQKGIEVQHDPDCHSLRSQAETAAFIKAFNILEKQL